MWHRIALVAALWFVLSPPVQGQAPAETWTLEAALQRAAEVSPALARARGALEAARHTDARAQRRWYENPELELGSGCCRDDDSLDFEMTLAQSLDGALRRAARREGSASELARAEVELAAARLQVAIGTARTFYRTLAARDRLALAHHDRELVRQLADVAERRFEAGELAALDMHRTTTAHATARSAERAAEAERQAALGALAALLGLGPPLGPPLVLAGDLHTAAQENADTSPPLEERSDLRAIRAELAAAEAEISLGRALARPGVRLRAGFEREERQDVFRAGIALSLPIAERGLETRAAGESRAAGLRQALAARRAAAEAETAGARAVLAERLAALAELESLLPVLADSERLALRSFEAGELGLGELLLARREILESRLTHLERQLEAVLARLDLYNAEGQLP